jgi:hypothetical protein
MSEVPGLYLETVTDTLTFIAANQFATMRKKTYTSIMQPSDQGYLDANFLMSKVELYINNIFVNPEIHDIYIARVGFSLVRVYREHITATNQTGTDEKLLSQLKWPIEYMFGGIRPAFNARANNTQAWRDWHRLTRMVDAYSNTPQYSETSYYAIGNTAAIPPLIPTPGTGPAPANGASVYGHASLIANVTNDEYAIPVASATSLTLTAHGVPVYDSFDTTMFNSYMPYHYGKNAIITPKDPGAFFINFALLPRTKYQPSGHLNISRARETYLKWTSSYVTASSIADMLITAIALNFLLITDGSAVLRYST